MNYVGVCAKLLCKEELHLKLKAFILPAFDSSKLNAGFLLPCLYLLHSSPVIAVRMPQQFMIIAKQFAFYMSCNLLHHAIGRCNFLGVA